ncbi:Serine/threonine protein kinase, partial [Globisporangium polare]
MSLQMRENGPILNILVAGLARVLRSIASGAVQLSKADIARLNEFYEGLLMKLESHLTPVNIFYRIASSRHVLNELDMLRQQLVDLEHLVTTAGTAEAASWTGNWRKCVLIREAQLANQLAETRALVEVLPDRASQVEALVVLKYELKVAPDQKLVSTAYNKVESSFKIDVGGVPDWLIPRYEVQYDASSLVGDGTFGAVYQGTWTKRSSSKRVAVKILRIHGLGGALAQGSFLSDLDQWFRLQTRQGSDDPSEQLGRPQGHENVLTLYGASHVGQQAFLVLEHADGGNVLDSLGEEMNISTLCKFMHQAARGLQYLHDNGIIHGHLRCSNLLISGGETVKVTDFGFDGIRNFVNALSYTKTPDTLQWTAPELLFSDREVPSRSSDVYSLAMCIIEALYRGPPWGDCDDSLLLEKIDLGELPIRPTNVQDQLWDLVVSMCASMPSDRPSLTKIASSLKRFANNEIIEPEAATESESQVAKVATLPSRSKQEELQTSPEVVLKTTRDESSYTSKNIAQLLFEFALSDVGWTVFDAIQALRDLYQQIKGDKAKCAQVIERVEGFLGVLQGIQDATQLENNPVLPRLATTISKFQALLQEHAKKHTLSRFFTRHELDEQILSFHAQIDHLFQML